MAGIWLQTSLFAITLFALPIGVLWWFTGSFLNVLGSAGPDERAHINIGPRATTGETRFFSGGDDFDDSLDNCPTTYGTSTLGKIGCLDSDLDGWADTHDDCPVEYGNSSQNNKIGCLDSDGDGLSDSIDIAPNDASQALARPDLSSTVGEIIGAQSSLDSVESKIALWLDASNTNGNGNTGIADGDVITKWLDLSGRLNNATVSRGEAVLSVKDDGSEIDFDGNDAFKLTQLPSEMGIQNSDFEMFVVIHGNNNVEFVLAGAVMKYELHTESRYFRFIPNGTTASALMDTSDSNEAGIYANRIIVNGRVVDDIGIISVNGADASSVASARTNDNTRIKIGERNNNTNRYKGTISEILIFNDKLTDQQRTEVNAYLANKWDILNMDSDSDGFTDDEEAQLGTSSMDKESSIYPKLMDHIEEITGSDMPDNNIESALSMWFDASNIDGSYNSTITDGQMLDKWTDLSGNNFYGNQKTESRQPSFIENSSELSNQSVVSFDTTNSWMSIAGPKSYAYHMFVVFRSKTSVWPNHGVIGVGDTSGNDVMLTHNSNRTTLHWIPRSMKKNNVKVPDLGDNTDLRPIDEFMIFNYKSRNETVLRNYRINAQASYIIPMEYAEILVFNRDLNAAEQNIVTLYLSNKWGLTDIVDSDADGAMDNIDSTLGVITLNQPPAFTSTAPDTINETDTYEYSVITEDLEGDTITLSYSVPESSTFVDNGNGIGTVTWETTIDDVGKHTIKVTASDGRKTASQETEVVVLSTVNNPPKELSVST